MSRKSKRNPPKLVLPVQPVRDPYWAIKILAKEVVIATVVCFVVFFGTGSNNWYGAIAAALACFVVASIIKLYRAHLGSR